MKNLGMMLFVVALSACDQAEKELPVTFKPHIPFCAGERTLTGTFMKLTQDGKWYLQKLPCTGDYKPLTQSDVKIEDAQPTNAKETGIIVLYEHKGTPELNAILQSTAAEMGGNAVTVKSVTAQEGENIKIATVFLSKP